MPTITDLAGVFTNVVAGQIATLDLPMNWVYQSLAIEYRENGALPNQATLEARITEVRVKLSGKVIRRFTAAQLNAIHAGYGQPYVSGRLTIFFAEIWRNIPLSEIATSWFVQGVATSFQVEVDIAGAAVNPTLQVFAEYGDTQVYQQARSAQVVPNGFLKHYTTRQIEVGGAGTVTLNDLGLPGFYHRLHLFEGAAGQVTEVTVKLGKQVVYRKPRTLMEYGITRRGGSLPTDLFTVAFDDGLRLGDVLPTIVTDKKGNPTGSVLPASMEIETNAANNITMVAEVFARV